MQDRAFGYRFKPILINALQTKVHITQAFMPDDLVQILALQGLNLASQISEDELESEGFVSVEHDLALLTELNDPFPHIIAKVGKEVVGYALVMLPEKKDKVFFLKPMFEQIEKLNFKGQKIDAQKYVVMGQVCIAKAYRGKGLFSALYEHMRNCLKAHFECLITEVSERNKRSLRAHQKVGFQTLRRYTDPSGERWRLISWDWS